MSGRGEREREREEERVDWRGRDLGKTILNIPFSSLSSPAKPLVLCTNHEEKRREWEGEEREREE